MAIIAVFNVKGGVGKTTTAVNLAWSSARQSSRRTLLWDLDPQGGSGFLLGQPTSQRSRIREVFARELAPEKLICASGIGGLDFLPADAGLGGLDQLLLSWGKKRRLAKLTMQLSSCYDRIILDCPPILNETADQIIRAATILVIPLTPSPLAVQALTDVQDHLRRNHRRHGPALPVFSMYDGRRKIHREAQLNHSNWPAIPMSSLVEQMGAYRKPIGAYAPSSKPARAFSALWAGIEHKLASLTEAPLASAT
jgi:chromosome partitioning protein